MSIPILYIITLDFDIFEFSKDFLPIDIVGIITYTITRDLHKY